jgi:hypothetical protein
MDLWQLLRDILLTGTGMFVILSQVFSPDPKDSLLVTGLALTVPAVAAHSKALLSRPGHTEGPSSPPPRSPGPPPSGSSSPGGTGDR